MGKTVVIIGPGKSNAIELDKLNKTQSNYLGLDIEGPFKPDYYRY